MIDCNDVCLTEKDMFDSITEDYINQRIGEQMLTADQWSVISRELVSLLTHLR